MCPAFRTNHRYLVRETWSGCGPIIEVRVLETSPQGRIKIRYLSGAVSWEFPTTFNLVEDLGEEGT